MNFTPDTEFCICTRGYSWFNISFCMFIWGLWMRHWAMTFTPVFIKVEGDNIPSLFTDSIVIIANIVDSFFYWFRQSANHRSSKIYMHQIHMYTVHTASSKCICYRREKLLYIFRQAPSFALMFIYWVKKAERQMCSEE